MATTKWDWLFQHGDGDAKVVNTGDKFEVNLECPTFTPDEMEVLYFSYYKIYMLLLLLLLV